MNPDEKIVLNKYINGAILDERDRHWVERLRSVGLMHTGCYFDEGGYCHETAKTTAFGRRMMRFYD